MFYLLEENELGDIKEEDIRLPLELMCNIGKTTKQNLIKDSYNKLMTSNEIYTWWIDNTDRRFGLSKDKLFYFEYNTNNNHITIHNNEDEFIKDVLFSFQIYIENTYNLNDLPPDIEESLYIYCTKNDFDVISEKDFINNLKKLLNNI